MNAFIEARYVVAFTGTTQGVVECQSVAHLMNVLTDAFPNPGCPVRAYLVDPNKWDECSEGMPSHVDYTHLTVEECYTVHVFRVMDLES